MNISKYNQFYPPLSNNKDIDKPGSLKMKAMKRLQSVIGYIRQIDFDSPAFQIQFPTHKFHFKCKFPTFPKVQFNFNYAKYKGYINIAILVVLVGGVLSYTFSQTGDHIFAFRKYPDVVKIEAVEDAITPLEKGDVLGVEFASVPELKVNVEEVDMMYQNDLEAKRIAAEQRKAEEERIRIRNQKIANLDAFLIRNGSPMAGFAETIITASETCDFNYHELLGISMKESGLGKVMNTNYKGTAFGYMDGVQGESWDSALPRIMCKVGYQYTNKYGLTLQLAKSYGPKSWTDDEASVWLGHVRNYSNMIP